MTQPRLGQEPIIARNISVVHAHFGHENTEEVKKGVASYAEARRFRARHRRCIRPLYAGLLLSILALCVGAPSAMAKTTVPTPGVIPAGAMPFGRSYAQWSAAQWQWELEQPNIASSPVVDQNAGTASKPEIVDCTLGQTGNVWFLSGISFMQSYTAAFRSCTVRAGVALFFPVVDTWIDNLNCPGLPQGTLTAAQLQEFVRQQTDGIVPGSMSVTFDGRSVSGLFDSSTPYRAAVNFSYMLPANNALSVPFCSSPTNDPFPAGTMPPPPGAFADGVYIMLGPLSAGVHHISFAARESGQSLPFGTVTQSVSYTITAVPQGQ